MKFLSDIDVEQGADVTFVDNAKALFGTSGDLEIYHDGSNSYIADVGTGDLTLRASNDLRLQAASTEAYLTCNENGSVEVYYNNSLKFETTTSGVSITGQAVISNGIDVNGGNVDLIDNVRLRLGTASDMQIYHDGSNSYVRDVGTGRLWIDSNGEGVSIISDGSGATPMAHFYKDAAVELYYNNVKRIETTSTGVTVTGNLTVTGAYYDSNNSPGTANQVLASTVTGTDWIDAAGTIGGSITDNQVAVGAATANNIEGSSGFTWDGSLLDVDGDAQLDSTLRFISTKNKIFVDQDAGTGFDFYLNNIRVGDLNRVATSAGQWLIYQYSSGNNAKQFPGYSFAGDTSTGMFLEDTDILAFSTAGESRLIIGTTGDVGIGTGVDAATQRLHVVGSARVTGAYYDSNNSAGSNGQVLSSTNSGTTTAWVNASSGGGIGGSIAATQVAFGDTTADEINGVSTFTYSDSGGIEALSLGDATNGQQTNFNLSHPNTGSTRARYNLYAGTNLRGYLQSANTGGEVTLLSNANLVLSGGTKVTIDGGSTSDIVIASASGSNVGIGNTSPAEKLDVIGRIKASKGVQVGEETSTGATSGLVGTFRYRTYSDATFDYSAIDVCMQDGAGAGDYSWVNIVTKRW